MPRRGGRVVMPGVIDAVESVEIPEDEAEYGLVPSRDPRDIGDLGTADRPGAEGDEIGGAAQAAPASLAHSSATMAIGTICSRGTGFIRTVVLAAVLGTRLLGDAYQAADMIPFAVYDLLIGGLLASVFVPFLVKRKKLDPDGGNATEQRLFTVLLLVLLVLTVFAVASADWLISLYAREFTDRQHELAVLLARFLFAQIFFIGASGIASTMLNTRGRFGTPMWAPVANNLVTIAAGLMFLWLAGTNATAESVSDRDLALLGLGSSLGMVAQAALLLWALHAAGFRWRPRLDLRGSGFGEAARTASWMMVYVAIAQVGLLISTNVAASAGKRAERAGDVDAGAGITAYKYASLLFQLPYAIIAVSVITALLPRMSAHVADGRKDLVRMDFSRGLRLASVLLVPLSLGMAVFAVPFSVLTYGRGSTSADDAELIGMILMVFAVMLIPFTMFQLLLRVFYALGDTKTPGLVAIPAEAAHAITAIVLLYVIPARHIVIWLPVAYGLYYLVGSVLAGLVLRRRLNGLDGRRMTRTLVLLHVAALPGVAAGAAAMWAFSPLSGTVLPALLSLLIGGGTGIVLFVVTARLLKITEVEAFLEIARTRVLRRTAAG